MKSITIKRPPDSDPSTDDVLSVGVKVVQFDLLKVTKVDGGVMDLLLLGQVVAALDDAVQQWREERVGLGVGGVHPDLTVRPLAPCNTRNGQRCEEGMTTTTTKRTIIMTMLSQEAKSECLLTGYEKRVCEASADVAVVKLNRNSNAE